MSLTDALTLAAVLVALFREQVWKWLSQPVLEVTHPEAAPEFVKTKLRRGETRTDCYFLRFLVRNKKLWWKPETQARDVEVFVADLRRVAADGSAERVARFLPMDLTWAHTLATGRQIETTPWHRTHVHLSPGMRRHCDLGFIEKPDERRRPAEELAQTWGFDEGETTLNLQVEKRPLTGGHVIGPGEYDLDILVGAANLRKPIAKTYRLSLSGRWHEKPAVMLREGISLEPI